MHDNRLPALSGLTPGDHLAFLYETEDQHRLVLTAFLRQGLERGEKVVYLLHAHSAEALLGYLRADGLDPDPFLERGQLVFRQARDVFLRDGLFEPPWMLEALQAETDHALAEGYPLLRITDEVTWLLKVPGYADRPARFETAVEDDFADRPCIALCQYDRRHFPPAALLEVIHTHSRAIVGAELYDNFYYVPPSDQRSPDPAEAGLDRWIRNLRQHQQAVRESAEERDFATAVLDTAGALVVVLDRDGRIVRFNHACVEATGYALSEAEGRLLWDFLLLPREAEDVRAVFGELREGFAPNDYENHWVTKTGDLRLIRWSNTAITDESGIPRYIIGTGIDVTEHREAENALRRERNVLNRLMLTSPVAIVVLDGEGRVTYANPRAELLLGLPHGTLAGRRQGAPGWRATDPQGRPLAADQLPFERAMATGRAVHHQHLTLERPDGRHLLLAVNAAPLFDDAGAVEGVIAMFDDVTEEVQAAATLRRQAEYLACLTEISSLLLTASDLPAVLPRVLRRLREVADADRCYLFENHPSPSGDLLTRQRYETCAPGVTPEIENPVMQDMPWAESGMKRHADEMSAGRPIIGPVAELPEAERLFLAAQGIYWLVCLPLQVAGEWWGFIGFDACRPDKVWSEEEVRLLGTAANAISAALERTRAEEELQHSNRDLRALVQASPAPIIAVDRETRVTLWNPAAERVFGWTESEVLGRRPPHVPDEARAEADALLAREAAGEALVGLEVRRRRKDGSLLDVSLSTAPLRDAEGAIVGAMRVLTDITARKQAETRLRESNAALQALVEASPAAIVNLDREGRVTLWNAAAERLFGWRADEVRGKPNPLIPLGQERKYRAFRRRVEAGRGFVGVELRLARRDGSPIDVSLSTAPVRDAQNRICATMGVFVDVGERRQTEEALAESEARYRLLFNSGYDAVFVHEISPDRRAPGRIIAANDVACQRLGYTREELLGMSVVDIDDPEAASDSPEMIERLLAEGHALFERVHLTRDGRRIPVEVSAHRFELNGRPVLLSIARDIARRKRAERELAALLRLHETTVAAIPLCLLVLDADLRVLMANVRCWEEAEVPPEVASGASLLSVLPDCLAAEPSLPERIRAVAEHGGEEELLGVRYHALDRERYVNIHLCGFRVAGESGGEEACVLLVLDDVTQEALAQEQLREAAKLESIGRLAGGIAHDFNNILTGITGYAQLLTRQVEDQGVLEDLLRIRELAGRAATLTSQLLAFSRRQPLQAVVVDLNALVGNVTEMLRRLIGEDIELVFRPGPELHLVRADPAQVEQALMNLAVNARDAMPSGGRLTVETANVLLDRDAAGRDPDLAPGPYVRVSVTDTGAGMSPETLARAFEPFFTTKEVGKGTGLGLATVYGTIKQHGGSVQVESEVGRGATFAIYLPRVEEGEPEQPREPVHEPPAPGGSETVLVVEDEASVRNLVEQILRGLGYTVLSAADPDAAERLLAGADVQAAAAIGLLLTDVVMPGRTGPELYEAVAARLPSLKVLYMSGYADRGTIPDRILAGGRSYIQKPFTPEALARAVRQVLDAP